MYNENITNTTLPFGAIETHHRDTTAENKEENTFITSFSREISLWSSSRAI